MPDRFLEVADISLYLLYLFTFTAYLFRKITRDEELDDKEKKALRYAWFFRIFMQIVSYGIYKFYYGRGDTINYIRDARIIVLSLYYNFESTIDFIWRGILGQSLISYLTENPQFYNYWRQMRLGFTYRGDPASATVSLLYVPFAMLSFGAEKASLIPFSTFMMLIQLRFYKLTRVLFPQSYKFTLPVQFFLPSLLVWTTTPYKEAFALNFMLLAMYLMFYRGMNLFRYGIAAILLYLTYQIKPYILLSFLPAFGALQLHRYSQEARYRLFFYISLVVSIPAILYIFSYLLQSSGKYSAENLLGQAYIVSADLRQNEAYYQVTGGSVYDIGDFEPTLPGILRKFPIAFFTGLFRPFLWESRKPIILLPALENFLMLVFLLRLGFIHGFGRTFANSTGNVARLTLLITSIVFLFMIGLISGNFGNLVRYRLPGLFFFYLVLFAAYGELKQEASNRGGRQQWSWRSISGRTTRLGGPTYRSP